MPASIKENLTSKGAVIQDLKDNQKILNNFLNLIKKINTLPDISMRFYEEDRSLYQATALISNIGTLEKMLHSFFSVPIKPAGQALPLKLRFNPVVRYLKGLKKDQTLYLKPIKTGKFYGVLWPWQSDLDKIEIHLGFYAKNMPADDYRQLQILINKSISRSEIDGAGEMAGGKIHGISIPSFLQMSEMEGSTCTLAIQADNQIGYLNLLDGNLIGAQTGNLKDKEAAYQIISWDNAVIEIQPPGQAKKNSINQPLMHILMESLKIKDETESSDKTIPAVPKALKAELEEAALEELSRKAAPGRKGIGQTKKDKEKTGQPALVKKLGLALLVLLIVVPLTLFFTKLIKSKQAATEYKTLIQQIEKQDLLEEKENLFLKYLVDHKNSVYADMIKKKIADLHKDIEDRDFEAATFKVNSLKVDIEYEKKALGLYSEFLKKYPHSHYTKEITFLIAGIKNLVDEKFYEKIKMSGKLDFGERLKLYRSYLASFPKGKYRQKVEKMIQEMGAQYFHFIQGQVHICQEAQNWEKCLGLCEDFLTAFTKNSHYKDVQILAKEIKDRQDLLILKKKVAMAGADYHKAKQIYLKYLKKHPNTYEKGNINQELAELEIRIQNKKEWRKILAFVKNPRNDVFISIKLLESYLSNNVGGPNASKAKKMLIDLKTRKESIIKTQVNAKGQQEEINRIQMEKIRQSQARIRLKKIKDEISTRLNLTGKRFVNNGNDTVTDTTTGLMWSLLDSEMELNQCLNYADALEYMKTRHYGGYNDWRFPTASELASIYKNKPYFPSSGAKWYWTSETFIKGYHVVANIVSAQQETIFEKKTVSQKECGAVRFVRP